MKAEEIGPSSNGGVFQFDVFLSFSGTDARQGFTSYLYKDLNQLGVITFMDSEDLQKGERIKQLFHYMESSQIFVPILSDNYAQSKWCLLEAAKMVEIVGGDKTRMIIPVFYYVDPSDVKDDGGLYQSAATELGNNGKLEDREVKECIGALKTIGSISGFHLKRGADVSEAEMVTRMVTRISKRVQDLFGRVPFGVQPIGFDSQIGELITKLDAQADGVCIIGICGMGGIGKTTLAKAIIDKLSSEYDGSSFIDDVAAMEERQGLPAMQQELICDVLNLKRGSISIDTVDEGRNIIKQRLNSKRVLLVLDNIVKLDQLKQLLGNHICHEPKDLFGEGSKIIVTTRDKAVLLSYGIKEHQIYYPEELKDPWRLKLFSRHAFMHKPPSFELLDLAKEVAGIAGGLPLVLVAVGSAFAGLFTKKEWEGELKKLRRKNKHTGILKKLKWSYDGLDDNQKCVFLDIACFFVGAKRKRATYLWDGCSPVNAITVLEDRNLINIDNEDRFRMHDLIQEMGRWIISGEGNLGPYMKSRLCYRNEESITSMNSLEKGKVEGIILNMEEECTETNLTTKVFVDMPKLRLLHLKFVKFLEPKIDHFPKRLKWLQWRGCELESVTIDRTSFKNLEILDLSQSSIYKLTLKNKLDRLKVLDLSNCYIEATPDFAWTPKLERLFLDDCGKLHEVHESICRLENLTTLSMRNCEFVEELPEFVEELSEKHRRSSANLSKLEELNLQGCQQLQSLPRLPSSLKTLILQGCKTLKPVHGFQNLDSMELLDMEGCENINFTLMSSLFEGKTFRHLEEFSASASKTLSEDEKFSFIVPHYSPLCLQQLRCYGDGSKSGHLSKIYINFCVTDMEDNQVVYETIFSSYRDIGNDISGQYGWCYTVSFSKYDDINFFPEPYRPCSICVSTADNFPLISVHILLRKAHRWNRNDSKVGHEVTNSRRIYAEQNQPLPSMNEAELIRKVVEQISLKMTLPLDDEGMMRDLNGRKLKMAEPSSSSLSSNKPRFDVILSFRGEDTRKGFTSHLYNALCQRGISTFIDSEVLDRGERIVELINYMDASKICVPVLSKGYADSRWCLREITKMVECGRLIIPIFYNVDPNDVQNQSGPFKAAFQRYKSSNTVEKKEMRMWKDALRAVGEIGGYSLQYDTKGNNAEPIHRHLPLDDEGMMRDLNGRKLKRAEPSSSSLSLNKPRFDVFLSFRGEDTRKGFTSHLYNALCKGGISTFLDSEGLDRGESIIELTNYMNASKIFVPVLSKGYADSRWCLREITEMVECGRLIIPIFFHVDPRDVRKQSGPFEAAFQKHESGKSVGEEDLRKWKDALEAVGKISGYSFQNDTDENEAHLIQNVVEQISRKLNKNARPITEHLVGMDSHIDKMDSLLDLASNEVKMIGIVGMGGVGKTTIATVVYNKLLSDFDFEDSSFISNVRENFKQHNGGVALQQRLIKDILKVEHPDVADVERGKSLIEDRLRSKKVLVTLDDADHIEQLEALAGKRNWFGSRSRIIITSRDSRVLLNHGVKEEHIYRPEVLDYENSLKLFESHAFRGVQPTESEYRELSMKFVKVTGGLPLGLTVIGSLLRGRNIKQWKENLDKLKQIANEDIVKRLMISYDGLEENVKQIFLDISCFLIGKQIEYATYMWKDCGLFPETTITELQERSLINVNEYDEFEMHDLLRDMGRGIAQQGEHWQWSRLWNLDDLLQSLAYKDKPRAKGIVIAPDDTPANDSETYLSTKYFVDFPGLRLLHLSGFAFKGEFLLLPKRLKWLRLSDCKFLNGLSGASNLNAISVLELVQVDDVARILVEQSSVSRKAFDALKVLRIESFLMTRTPEFSKMICLRKLTLRNCKMLTEVDGSIGSLKSLVHLDLRDCHELQRLPDSICMLMSLETLILVRCRSVSSLPEQLGDLKSLRELRADDTGIHAIPDSIGYLSNLCTLSFNESDDLEELPNSICTLMSLKTLILIGCNSLSSLPEKLGDMKSLRELRVEETSISAIPDSIGDLSNLRTLSLNGNYNLEKLPDSMRMLDFLEELYIDHLKGWWFGDGFANAWCYECAKGSESLAVLPNSACQKVKELRIDDDSIQELPPNLGRLTNLKALSIRCPKLRSLPEWLGQLQKVKSFELESDSLEALPARAGRTFEDWIASQGRLEELSLKGCNSITFIPLTQTVLDSALFFLTSLTLASGCLLRTLNLSYTNICCLPSSLSNLAQLQELHLEYCENLQSIPRLPSSLHVLDARGCNKLRKISDVSNLKSLMELKLSCCRLLRDFCGLESIAHNLETLELPGPCGCLQGFSQLSPDFMTRVFKGAAFSSSLKTFCVYASGEYGEPTDHHQPFWITFPKVGRRGKRPTLVSWSFIPYLLEEQKRSISISIMEEDGHAVYQCTTRNLYQRIRGEELAEYSGEGYYVRMQVSGPTSILNEIRRHVRHASLKVEYTLLGTTHKTLRSHTQEEVKSNKKEDNDLRGSEQ